MKDPARRLAAPAWAAALLTLSAQVASADTRPLDAAEALRQHERDKEKARLKSQFKKGVSS